MNSVYQTCEARLPEALALWEELVNIDSGSGDSQGLIRVASVLEERLTALGMRITRHSAGTEGGEYSFVATKEGTGTKSALLMAHMDTVFGPGTVAERPFRIEGDVASGPGVADCKGGIVLMVLLAAMLEESSYSRLSLLFNCDEEISSPSSKDIVVAESARHDLVLAYEPGGPGDKVAVSRKGNGKVRVRTFGQNSHAGVEPEKGVNAMAELVWQVNRLLGLSDPDKKTTVTFTIAKSGERVNVVPDTGEAWADVRVSVPEELDRIEKTLAASSAEQLDPRSRVEAVLIRNRPPFPRNPDTDKLAVRAAEIYGEIGRNLAAESVGGVGDVNFAYGHGSVCLCRVGPVSIGPSHTINESASVSSMVSRLYLSLRLIQDFCA